MKKHALAAALAACVLAGGCSLRSSGGGSGSDKESSAPRKLVLEDIKGFNGGKEPEIEYRYDSDVIYTIDGIVDDYKVRNKDDALFVIKELAGIINVSDPDEELRFSVKNPGADENFYVFDQYYKDVPVNFSSVTLTVAKDGTVTRLLNRYHSGIDLDTEPGLSAEKAADIAKKEYPSELNGEPELFISVADNDPRLAWRVMLKRGDYPDELHIDAQNGSVISMDGPIPD